MRPILLALALLAASPVLAERPVPPGPRTGSGASSYEVRQEGQTLVLTARNLRFDPYAVARNDRFVAHLLTIRTTTSARTEADGGDGRVAVTVDDLSGVSPRRLAAFTDPGVEGVRHGERHFVTTAPGCCADPTVHRVRRLPDGRLLFRATGPGPVGTSAFLEAPNGGLGMRRWAAYDGAPEEGERGPGILGILAWGDGNGMLHRLRLGFTGSAEEAASAEARLAHEGRLLWAEPDRPQGTGRPDLPHAVRVLTGARDAAAVRGFSVRLLDGGGRVVADIPVMADRLVPERATLATGYALTAVPDGVPAPAAPQAIVPQPGGRSGTRPIR